MFLNRTHVCLNGLQSLRPGRKKKAAEGFRLGLVLRQQHERLLVPKNQVLHVIPFALDALEIGTERVTIGRMVFELASGLRVFRDASKPAAHMGARRAFAVPREATVGLNRLPVVAAEQAAPQRGSFQSIGAFQQFRRGMSARAEREVEFLRERLLALFERFRLGDGVFDHSLRVLVFEGSVAEVEAFERRAFHNPHGLQQKTCTRQ